MLCSQRTASGRAFYRHDSPQSCKHSDMYSSCYQIGDEGQLFPCRYLSYLHTCVVTLIVLKLSLVYTADFELFLNDPENWDLFVL